MSTEDLERKLALQEKLLSMLEQRIAASETLSGVKDNKLLEQEEEIKRLQEELHREKNRPVQLSQPTDGTIGGIDLSKISAAELLILAERKQIPWGR